MKFSLTIAALASATTVLAAPRPSGLDLSPRQPPGIPSASAAKSLLAGLKVATAVDDGTYDRDLFPHWSIVDGKTCDGREYTLKRDGTGVEVDSACKSTSGSWTSPYDGGKWTNPQDLDIDHMVPLKNAWISGASKWTTDKREQFANDIEAPQLWAVTDNVNQQKSDQSPDEWLPPDATFHCTYARAWIAVKDKWALTITSAEKNTLGDLLSAC